MTVAKDDRSRILARRARFVAAALAATALPHVARAQSETTDDEPSCDTDPSACRPQICLSDDIIEGELEPAKDEPAPPPQEPAPQVCLSVTPETADQPRRHDGWYLRFALGGGFLGMSQRGDRGSRSLGGPAGALTLDFGTTIARGLVSGFGASVIHTPDAPSDPGDASVAATLVLAGPVVDFYPDPLAGFHVGGRVGPAISLLAGRPGAPDLVATGLGGSAFIGVDGFVADSWSLGFVVEGSAAGGAGTAEDAREINVARAVSLKLSLLMH